MTAKLPLVSVIIPFYKGKSWLEESLESVFKQTYTNIEVVLVNDGSTEDISDILSKYAGKLKYIYQENKGAAVARNEGIKLAEGEFIAFLDADDIWFPQKLEVQISTMLQTNSFWSHTSYLRFNSLGVVGKVDVSNYCGDVFPICILSSPIATPTVVIKRVIFEEDFKIRFPEGIAYGEDTILWMLLSLKYKLTAIKEPLVKVRLRGTNASMVAYRQIEGRSSVWKWIIENKPYVLNKIKLHDKLAYSYCTKLDAFLKRKQYFTNSELLMRCFYFPAWVTFKLDSFFYHRIKKHCA